MVVRTFAGGTVGRDMDRGCSRDADQAGAKAEDRPPGRTAVTATADRRPLSQDLGTRSRKSGPAATAVAPAPAGTDAHAHYESAACGGTESGSATQEGAVAAGGTQRTGVVGTGPVGKPASPRPARPTRPADAEDPGAEPGAGGGSRETGSGASTHDLSRSRPVDGPGLRTGHRKPGTFSLR